MRKSKHSTSFAFWDGFSILRHMRIGFFGTPSLARSVLSDLISDSRIEVAFVVTNPDAPVGRKGILTPTPVKELATVERIPVFTPTKIRNNTELHDTLRSYQCDYFVVVAYGRILPNAILEMPKKLAINIH
jgi:methionyl-tRNA formyltransferase